MNDHSKKKSIKSKPAKKSTLSLALIEHEDGAPRVDHRAVADEMGVSRLQTRRLIEKYISEFHELGSLDFKSQSRSHGRGGGVVEKCYELTEAQATFLLTLSRNSPKVVKLKLKLTKLFECYKKAFIRQTRKDAQQAKREWLEEREGGKFERRGFTDAAQDFIEMAKLQGSRNSHHYYRHLTETPYKALDLKPPYKGIRDRLTEEQLREVRMIESVGASMIRQVVGAQLHYKQQGFPALKLSFQKVAPQIRALIEMPLLAN